MVPGWYGDQAGKAYPALGAAARPRLAPSATLAYHGRDSPLCPRGSMAIPSLKSAPSTTGPGPGAPLGRDVLKRVLPNGLTLLVKPARSAPVVAVNAWVKAGSVCEREEERGISHFI